MMYKLWRKEGTKPSLADFNSKKRQAQFSANLTQLIKIIRKKQQFYIRILFMNLNSSGDTIAITTSTFSTKIISQSSLNTHFHTQSSLSLKPHTTYSHFTNSQTLNIQNIGNMPTPPSKIKIFNLQNQAQSLLFEEEQNITNLKKCQSQSFYLSKTFLYTMFVRLLQIFQYCKQKTMLKIKNHEDVCNKNWQRLYEDNKAVLTDCYQNLVYLQNYNVVQLINVAVKKQNHRIYSVLPARIKKNQISLKPIIRLNSSEVKKTQSIDLKSKKTQEQNQIVNLINKKLMMKDKNILFTEKRIQERKKQKQKPIGFKCLYGIMNIKIPKLQEGNAFRKFMEIEQLERNQLIHEQRKKWQKKCQNKNKLANVQKQQKQCGLDTQQS